MQRFTRLEDMESWKKGKELTRIVTQIAGLTLDCERLITGLIRFLKQSPYRGSKFKTKEEGPKPKVHKEILT